MSGPNDPVDATGGASTEHARAVYDQLVDQARANGRKPGWAYHKFRESQGHPPPDEWVKSTKSSLASDPNWIAAIEAKSTRNQAASSDDPRRLLRIKADFAPVYDEALEALLLVEDQYERAGKLSHVHQVAVDEIDPQSPVRAGAPTIQATSSASLMLRLSRVARWEKYNEKKQGWVEARPDKEVIAALRDEGCWPGIRRLIGIAEAPFLREDGTVCQTPGFDSTTGYIFAPNADFPEIKANSTRVEAVPALERLVDIFSEFPYAQNADLYVPISNLLSIIGRPAIRGPVPAHLFDAASRGSGKTLQVETVANIATGRDAPLKDYPITRPFKDRSPETDEEEMRKILDGYGRMGVPMICLDNIREGVDFGGSSLELALTNRGERDIRPMGRNDENVRVPWRAVVSATGNNLSVQGNTQRRSICCRLETAEAHPEDNAHWRHKLPEDALKRRPELVADALTVLVAWQNAMRSGARSELPPWDPFDEWVRVVAAAIVHAGGEDVLQCRIRDESEDTASNPLSALLLEMPRGQLTAQQLVEASLGDAKLHRALSALLGPDKPATSITVAYALRQVTGSSGKKRRTGSLVPVAPGDVRRLLGLYDGRIWLWSVEHRRENTWQSV